MRLGVVVVVMAFPLDVTVCPDGLLLVPDRWNDRIMIYTLTGTKAQLVDVWNGLDSVEGVTVAPDGRIFASLTADHRVVQLQEGEIVRSVDYALGTALQRPHDIEASVDKDGLSIIVADSDNHRLVVFNDKLEPLFEISTWDPPLSEPKYFSATANGTVYIADSYNNRIRVFTGVSRQQETFADGEVGLPEGIYVKGDRAWVSDTEGGRVLLYRRGQK